MPQLPSPAFQTARLLRHLRPFSLLLGVSDSISDNDHNLQICTKNISDYFISVISRFRCVLCFDLIAPDCVIPICHAWSYPTFEVIEGAVEVKLTARQIRKRKQHPVKRLRDLLLSKLAPILSSELMQGKQKKSYNSTAKWFYRRRLRGPSPGLPFPPRPRQQHSNSCKHRQTECMSPWLFK